MISLNRIINKMQGNKKGFTLIELMIVVAILGILAAIAIPNFMRFQAKSKQSEAKTNLGAIGTTAEAYHSENDTYVATWADLGWAPQGKTRYAYFYNTEQLTGTPTDAAGCESDGTDAYDGGAHDDGTNYASVAAQDYFMAVASGNIDSESKICDVWNYDEERRLRNPVNDVSLD